MSQQKLSNSRIISFEVYYYINKQQKLIQVSIESTSLKIKKSYASTVLTPKSWTKNISERI